MARTSIDYHALKLRHKVWEHNREFKRKRIEAELGKDAALRRQQNRKLLTEAFEKWKRDDGREMLGTEYGGERMDPGTHYLCKHCQSLVKYRRSDGLMVFGCGSVQLEESVRELKSTVHGGYWGVEVARTEACMARGKPWRGMIAPG